MFDPQTFDLLQWENVSYRTSWWQDGVLKPSVAHLNRIEHRRQLLCLPLRQEVALAAQALQHIGNLWEKAETWLARRSAVAVIQEATSAASVVLSLTYESAEELVA